MSQKEYEAFWRGFSLAKTIINNSLQLCEFDLSKCKNNKHVCEAIRRSIADELKQYQSGDHKYGEVK